jgi:hypothetical protein
VSIARIAGGASVVPTIDVATAGVAAVTPAASSNAAWRFDGISAARARSVG